MYCKIHLLEITGWFQIPSALTREDKNSVLRSKYKKTRATPMQPTAVTVRADWREKRDESETHGVGRVLSFSPVVGIGNPPTPHPQASVPISLGSGGGAHSLARAGGRVLIPTRVHTLWYSLLFILYICILWRDHFGPDVP